MNKCTCGANAIKSNHHARYCDYDKKPGPAYPERIELVDNGIDSQLTQLYNRYMSYNMTGPDEIILNPVEFYKLYKQIQVPTYILGGGSALTWKGTQVIESYACRPGWVKFKSGTATSEYML